MKDLKIRVLSNLKSTQQVLLYQQDLQINVKNYKVAAWEHVYIAPDSRFDVALPMDISVAAWTGVGKGGMTTKTVHADYNTAWDVYDNGNALDICKNYINSASDDTIEINNRCHSTKFAVVMKDGKPLFGCDVRPEYKLNFAIHPTLYVALSDIEIHDNFFDAVTLSRQPLEIHYEGQEYLTITLNENVGTGGIEMSYGFEKF